MKVNFQDDSSDDIQDLVIKFSSDDSEQLQRIVRGPLRTALDRFARKNRGYSTSALRFSGSVMSEYFQIERKVGKLWAGIIAGDKDAFADEPAAEILDDLIGHCLLMKDHLNRGEMS